jgi:hypothetical protein
MLANLQERRVFGRLNKIALRIDQKQSHRAAFALGSHQH